MNLTVTILGIPVLRITRDDDPPDTSPGDAVIRQTIAVDTADLSMGFTNGRAV